MISEPDGFLPLFLDKAASEPSRTFAVFAGAPVTFGDIARMSAGFAAAFQARGLGPGARVAVMMRNAPETLGVLFGIARLGATWVPVNVRLLGEGLRYILEHCRPDAIVADTDLVDVIAGSDADVARAWLVRAGGAEDALADLFAHPAPPSPTTSDAPFAIMYTSGTTGRPKGVVVTHRMLRLAGEAVATLTAAEPADVLFVWEPLYHIGGAQLIVLPLIRDVSLAMAERFSASRFWDQVREVGATHIHYLGGILQMLLKQPARDDDRRHPVRVAWGGGCPAEIWTAFEARFGVQVRECYGMTEASSITTCNLAGRVGSVGRPMPWFSIVIVDGTGASLPAGERGEIVVRTSLPGAIFPGYDRNPEATARALQGDGLHTGDLGSLDESGDLFFHGRLTDSVRCRGENVSAWEVEHVAADHPEVEDCAMVGVAADVGEQDIMLFVQRRPDATIDEASLADWLARRLASYQVPRYIAFVDGFERTPSQRIMKHRLQIGRSGRWDRLALGASRLD